MSDVPGSHALILVREEWNDIIAALEAYGGQGECLAIKLRACLPWRTPDLSSQSLLLFTE